MTKSRMEAFSDGVLAIIITIMVLKLKAPQSHELAALHEVLPTFVAYLLSYIYIGIYWINHHQLVATVSRVSGGILWLNLHWLFWMSLIPMSTEWMGFYHFHAYPTFFYGFILFMCAVSYLLLQGSILRVKGRDSAIGRLLGRDWKGKLSPLAYLAGMAFSFFYPPLAYGLYALIALAWFLPDRRMKKIILESNDE